MTGQRALTFIFSTEMERWRVITNSVTTSTTTVRVTETKTDLPSELQDGLGGGGDVAVRPGEEVELGHRPCLPSLAVLEVERPDEVIVAPNMLRHKVNLKSIIILDPNHGCGVDRREIYITCNWTIHPMMVFIRENMFFPPWLSK